MEGFTHLDSQGRARMVDVTAKPETERTARAAGRVLMKPEVIERLREGRIEKGDVFAVAKTAGIMAAKATSSLIPLCHPLQLTHVDLSFETTDEGVEIRSSVRLKGRTGAEMEALAAVSIAALTVYDMCKALDRTMVIEGIRLLEKSGGRSGHFVREEPRPDTGGPRA